MKEFRQKYEIFLKDLMKGNEYIIELNDVLIIMGKKIRFTDDTSLKIYSEEDKLLAMIMKSDFNNLKVITDEGTSITIEKIKKDKDYTFQHEIRFKEIHIFKYYNVLTNEELYPYQIEARKKIEKELKEKERKLEEEKKEKERILKEKTKRDWLPFWQNPSEDKLKVS